MYMDRPHKLLIIHSYSNHVGKRISVEMLCTMFITILIFTILVILLSVNWVGMSNFRVYSGRPQLVVWKYAKNNYKLFKIG